MDFDGERSQRWDGVNSAGTQEEESGLVLPAVLEEVDSAAEVMIEEVLGAGLAINSCQDAGIRSAVENPVSCWQCCKILFVADVPYPDINTEGTQWIEVGLAPLADEAVDTGDLKAWKMLKKPAGNDGSGEATNAGDEEVHGGRGSRETRVECRGLFTESLFWILYPMS